MPEQENVKTGIPGIEVEVEVDPAPLESKGVPGLEVKPEIAFFGPWIGEFGWELMTWQAWCREQSTQHEKCYACSFPDMAPLYEDFAEFIPHNYPKRHLDWRDTSQVEVEIPEGSTVIKPFKSYRVQNQHFIRFGDKDRTAIPKIILHARGINKGGKNYPLDRWKYLCDNLEGHVAFVGTESDHHIKGTIDLREIPLKRLMDELANAKLVIGQSSGVMHLAALCGAPLVVWGDPKTYFNEPLSKRYEETWNPFNVPVSFMEDREWNPDPHDVLIEVDMALGKKDIQQQVSNDIQRKVGEKMGVPVPDEFRSFLMKATKSKKWLATVHYLDANDTLQHFWITRNFPTNEMQHSMDYIKTDMDKGGIKKKKIVHAAVERSGYQPPEAPPEEGVPPEDDSEEAPVVDMKEPDSFL